jgi:hypothetical protein
MSRTAYTDTELEGILSRSTGCSTGWPLRRACEGVDCAFGHRSISTTLNIYAHVLAEHMEQFALRHLRWGSLQKSRKSRSI